MFNILHIILSVISGLQKIGVRISLLNFNLRNKSLSHTINSCEPQTLIIGQGKELMDAVMNVKSDIGNMKLYSMEEELSNLPLNVNSFYDLWTSAPSDNVDRSLRSDIESLGTNVYIFTSGTTGS